MPHTVSSRVQLTLLSLFRQHGKQAQPVVGTSVCATKGMVCRWLRARFHFDRAMDAKAPPRHGSAGAFGIRDALDELQHWRMVARTSQAQFAYLQLQVEVGTNASVAPTRQMLREQAPAALSERAPQRCRVPEGAAGALCPICGARRRQSRARHGPCAADGAAPGSVRAPALRGRGPAAYRCDHSSGRLAGPDARAPGGLCARRNAAAGPAAGR
jgi:hypothetical protein